MKHKIIKIGFLLFLLMLFCIGCSKAEQSTNHSTPYMVLIGEEDDIVGENIHADILVIDAEYFSAKEIAELKENGAGAVYTYINIGSIENFRDYYADYEKYTLGDYENWPEEKWIDISQSEWQAFLADRIKEFSDKGVDGFFVDNTDVYYYYPNDDIFQGIVNTLKCMKECDKKIIINGGDNFVKKYIEDGFEDPLFDAVNQENVYTSYDFDKESCEVNDQENKKYYTEYLDLVVSKGYTAYTLEYADDEEIANEAEQYSKDHGYICYVSDNIELKMNQ